MDNKQIDIEQELDRTKSAVFLGNNAAFLGSILCSMEFEWNSQIQTARTNGLSVQWNPDWFLELTPDERKTVLLHELWHAARLHAVRKGTRDNELWNKACDIRINNDLYREGYTFGEHLEDCFMDDSYDMDSEHLASEEAIYDALQQEQEEENQNNGGGNDSNSDDGENSQEEKDNPSNGEDFNKDLEESSEISPQQQQQMVNTVVNAIQQANMNKAHRDRIAFMRICSGKFEKGMEVMHMQQSRKIKLSQPQQFMAQDREIVEEAYAGDVIGVFDPGIFSIGDTLCDSSMKFEFK